jgi:hypothetical protein
MAAPAVLALAALAAVAVALGRPSADAAAAARRPGLRIRAREAAAVVAAGLVWGLPNAGFAALLGFAPVFFVEGGMSAQAAGALASLVAFATVPTGPLGGWLLGRLGRPLGRHRRGARPRRGRRGAPGAGRRARRHAGRGRGGARDDVGPDRGLAGGRARRRSAARVGMGLFWTVYFAPMTLLPPVAGLARDLTGDAAAPLAARRRSSRWGLLALARSPCAAVAARRLSRAAPRRLHGRPAASGPAIRVPPSAERRAPTNGTTRARPGAGRGPSEKTAR